MGKTRILTNILTFDDALTYLFKEQEKTTKRLYLKQDMTAREVCKVMGLEKFYNSNMQKHFFRQLGRKGKGWGGSRPGSGNKPGVQFCAVCRKKKGTCEH